MKLAEILVIGDELLAGEIEDRNGPFFARRLGESGFRTREIRLLPDEAPIVTEAVRTAMARSEAVVVCGGLGPTTDDITTEAVAIALGRPLVLDEPSWARIRARFAARGMEPPAGNEKQARIPTDACLLENPLGTAPGYVAETLRGFVAVFPGPPRENQPMFETGFVPWLTRRDPAPGRLVTVVLRSFGLPESEVGRRLREVEASCPSIRFGYQFRFPEVLVKLRADTGSGEALAAAERDARAALHPHVYATGEADLPEVLGKALAARGLRMVTAESCTGGLAAKLLTDTPGSSAWMEAGFVTYSNEAKEELLGVPREALKEHGAVSELVARAMLEGALARTRAQVGIALTGIAGPDGGTPEKPVGTVCIAWGSSAAIEARTYHFPFWTRDHVRLVSAWTAFSRLYRTIQ
jgi:nicotinamide-nucleotide amidase